jgi:cell wall-associated NlpC family hydrolase
MVAEMGTAPPAAAAAAAASATAPNSARLLCGDLSDCGKYLACENGFVPLAHVSEIGRVAASPADVAEQLIGTPYSWGGRSGDSLDCSGLVQLVFGLKGIMAPRDADMQMADFGDDLPEGATLERGDLVFFPGHVGIMADACNIIHANGSAMAVSVEPLADAAAEKELHEEALYEVFLRERQHAADARLDRARDDDARCRGEERRQRHGRERVRVLLLLVVVVLISRFGCFPCAHIAVIKIAAAVAASFVALG